MKQRVKNMVQYALFTNTGNREKNEDSIGAIEKDNRYCFVLCDGLGGHGMGDVASNLVKNRFIEDFENNADIDLFINKTFMKAQQELLAEQQNAKTPYRMKTTCVLLTMDSRKASIGYIGDSRAYIFNHNKIVKRTLDHSVPQMLALSKEIKESEIRNHPQRNILLRVMGDEWEKPLFEVLSVPPLKKCQAFLLCSDGFWELIDENEMCKLLKSSSSPEEWLNSMTKIVTKNGEGRNMDNYSAIAVWNVKRG